MQYLTSYFCVCLFVGFLLNLALCRSREAARKERVTGEKRGEAKLNGEGQAGAGRALLVGLSAHCSQQKELGKEAASAAVPPDSDKVRGEAVQGRQPQGSHRHSAATAKRGCMASMGLATVPAPAPGSPTSHPHLRSSALGPAGEPRRPLAGHGREGTGAESCP